VNAPATGVVLKVLPACDDKVKVNVAAAAVLEPVIVGV
jgi:hypothetical protein